MTQPKPERKLLRIEARNTAVPIEKKPEWIKTTAKMGPEYQALQSLVKTENLHTRLPRGRMPKHLRMLGRSRSNVFDRWLPMHQTL